MVRQHPQLGAARNGLPQPGQIQPPEKAGIDTKSKLENATSYLTTNGCATIRCFCSDSEHYENPTK
jgi:hypothetical protein